MTDAVGPEAQAAQRTSLPAVPRLFDGQTIICLAPGPSLTEADLALVQASRHPTIAVNNAILHAPWADVYYAADRNWWTWHKGTVSTTRPPLTYALQPEIHDDPDLSFVTVLQRGPSTGLDRRPTHLASGGHSGYQAINLAVHLGAKRIVLLGYDLQPAVDPATGRWRHHAFGQEHPNQSHPHYAQRAPVYATLVQPLADLSIEILNCSRHTAIGALPRRSLAATI